MLASMRLGRAVMTACGARAAVLLHFLHFLQALRQAASSVRKASFIDGPMDAYNSIQGQCASHERPSKVC